MPPQRLMRVFLFLCLATGIALLYGSIETVRSTLSTSTHVNPHLVVLGSVEAVAAVLFLIPRLLRFGAIGLFDYNFRRVCRACCAP